MSAGRQKRASSTDREMFWNTSITAHVLSNLKVCTRYSVEVRAYTTAGPGSFGAIDGPIETSGVLLLELSVFVLLFAPVYVLGSLRVPCHYHCYYYY